jgi:hypothetical protein
MKRLTPLVIGIALSFAIGFVINDVVPLSAQEFAKYCNTRYGFCVSYPSNFSVETPPANNDGRRFSDRNSFVLTASAINNVLENNLQAEMRSQSEDFDKITYRSQGVNWFILSGYKGVNILYRKTFVGRGAINHLDMEYSARLKTKYDEVVSKVVRFFQPGNLNASH